MIAMKKYNGVLYRSMLYNRLTLPCRRLCSMYCTTFNKHIGNPQFLFLAIFVEIYLLLFGSYIIWLVRQLQVFPYTM